MENLFYLRHFSPEAKKAFFLHFIHMTLISTFFSNLILIWCFSENVLFFLHIQLYVQSSLKIILLISVPFDVFSINSSQKTVAFSPFFFFLRTPGDIFSEHFICPSNHRHPPNCMTPFNKSALIHAHTHPSCLSLRGFIKDKNGLKMKYSDKLASLSLSCVGFLSWIVDQISPFLHTL